MKHDDVIGRLRSLSRQSVDDRVASAHLDRAAAAATARSGSHQRAALVAAACLAAVALPAAGIVLARAGHGTDPARNQPVLPAVELSCPGEALVIGDDLVGDTIAAGAADPQAEPGELVQRRAVTCPRPEAVVDSTTPAATECFGPLSGVATPAESDDPRANVVPSTNADGAATQARAQRECRTATSNTPTPATGATVANPANNGDGSAGNVPTPADAEAGRPPGASNSAVDGDHPPDNVPAAADAAPGPRPGVPGPPDNAPAAADAEPGVPGPPDNVPAAAAAVPGPSADVAGPPEGVPNQSAGGR